jgi:rubrerythrin
MAENPQVISPKNKFTCRLCGFVIWRKRTEPAPQICPSCKTAGSHAMESDESNVFVEKA